MKKTDIHKLEKAVDDYVRLLVDKGFSEKTFVHHNRIAKYFIKFVRRKKISWDNLFTIKTLNRFLKIQKSKRAGSAIRELAKYLYSNGRINKPLMPASNLPGIYIEYLEYKAAIRSTIWEDKIFVKRFHNYLMSNNTKLHEISIGDLDTFLSERHKHLSISSINKARTSLRSFLQFIHRKKILHRELSHFITNRREFAMSKPPKFLRQHEIKILFDSLQFCTNRDLRKNAFVYLAYTLGLRPAEISQITLDDISFKKQEVIIHNHKNNTSEVMPLPDDTMKTIIAYIIGARPKSIRRALFLSLIPEYIPIAGGHVAKEITAGMKRAGLSSSSYSLRHTYAQSLLEQGASFYEIKEMLRHENFQSTGKYIAISIKHMRRILFNEDV